MIRDKVVESTRRLICTSDNGNEILVKLLENWKEHKSNMGMIKDILMYMDKVSKRMNVYHLGIKIFGRECFFHLDVKPRIINLLLECIESERNGYVIDRVLVHGILHMLVELNVEGINIYEQEFEQVCLEASRLYYRTESQKYLAENQCPQYLDKALLRLHEESVRISQYLIQSTGPKLIHIIEHELITVYAQSVVTMPNSGLVIMMKEDKIAEIKKMYTLLSRVPGTLDFMRDCMGNYVKDNGMAIVASEDAKDDPISFVQQILDLKVKFDTVVAEGNLYCSYVSLEKFAHSPHIGFKNEKRAQKDLKDAFEEFLNRDVKAVANLASYVDEVLKVGAKIATEVDIEKKLDQVIVIFKFLTNKDLFECYHKQFLCKRLLNNKSISEEMEKLMIAKLKSECGQQFTSKIEGMLLDMNLSKEIMESYKKTEYFSSCPIEMDVCNLTSSHWSLKTDSPIAVPAVISDGQGRFTAYYIEKFRTGRRLMWLLNMGTADVRATFKSGKKELNVTTYQMCILMLFNNLNSMTLDQIRSNCAIPEKELRRQLLSLCTPKMQLFFKSSTGKNIDDNEVITFNEDFASKFKRIKVPLISVKDNSVADIDSVIPSQLQEDRTHQLDATIVRILKTKKQISHNDLVAEVTRILSTKFVPVVAFIKKRIESLIERDYLTRDSGDNKVYKYVA